MIKEKEIAMVNAADYALNYLNENRFADAEEIIKSFIKKIKFFKIESELEIYCIASINEILKIKKLNKTKTKKQLLQILVKNLSGILSKIDIEEI